MLPLAPDLKQVLPKLRRQHKSLYWLSLEATESSISQVVVKPLTRKEYMHVEADVALGCDPTDIIMETCVVWPVVDWKNIVLNPFYDLPYRAFDQISETVIEVSRFTSTESIAETFMEARQAINSLDGVMIGVICRSFGGLTPQMLDDMTLWDLARLFAMAEQTLPEPIDLRLFLDPAYAARMMAKMESQKVKKGFKIPGMEGRFGGGNGNIPDPVDLRAPLPADWDSSTMPPEITATDISRLHGWRQQEVPPGVQAALLRRSQEGTMEEGTL